ncbi:MAG: type I DNA topoisomerase [SAR324 cluster bacterium]|nr:type I DNA topoisomerase [SAR324 cluster bacterium]
MGKTLVIVESPTKARTISQFVDQDQFIVESSIGHIRDLPESASEIPEAVKGTPLARLSIDVDNQFKPLYIIPADKKKQVAKLKALLKDADRLYLATDEDREGEAISWHLKEVLQPKVPTQRLVFHEITKEAIEKALQSPREIDLRLVTAQETRRVMDRLYGYEISPVLWRKIAPKLSAGRVQSVAVRMIVNRERERIEFVPASYWDLTGEFAGVSSAAAGTPFKATLVSLAGRRLVEGRDFEAKTGKLSEGKTELAVTKTGKLAVAKTGAPAEGKTELIRLGEASAEALREALSGESWRVAKIERKPYTTKPPAPFTTSTLQQEGNRKQGLGTRETMRLAQGLYEKGFITYMRTDSTTLSEQALNAARSEIRSLYGEDYLPASPRVYLSKVKNAQEAHEAIRPAGESFRRPESLKGELESSEWRLYEMIWKRTMASQMPDARGMRTMYQLEGGEAVFQASGKTIEFPGFLRAYVEGSDDPEAVLGDQEIILPSLSEGEPLRCLSLETEKHTTMPPARYSEASLIKELEKEGIGRPSTYASIIDTIIRREYVTKKGKAMVPTFTAIAVVRLLEQYFTHLVDIGFTAEMENVLDAISRGEKESLPYLEKFYNGEDHQPGLRQLIEADIDAREACTIPLGEEDRQHPITVRIGKYGPYLERNDQRAPLPMDITPDELTLAKAQELLEKGASPEVLGEHPETKQNIYLKNGRFGPYVQLGETGEQPKMKSLLPGWVEEEVTFEQAMQLLSLPRDLGADPETGETVTADLGRFGPYIRRGKDTRSLPSAEGLFTLTLEEARAILRQEKSARRGAATMLKALGEHPGSKEPVNLMSGRYGPYVTDGSVNASLPRGGDPERITLEEAVKLLAERAAKGPVKRGRKPAARSNAAAKTAGGAKTSSTRTARKGRPPKKTGKPGEDKQSGASPASAPKLRKRGDRG